MVWIVLDIKERKPFVLSFPVRKEGSEYIDESHIQFNIQ